MAFGKDSEQLKGVHPFGAGTSFAQRVAFFRQQQSEQRQRKGGGGGWRFADIYKPTLSQTGFDTVRLVAGNYAFKSCNGKKEVFEYPLEYWPFIEHYDGRTERSTLCSGGVFHNFKEARDPCHGCDLFFSTMEKEKGPDGRRKSRVSKQDKYAFNVLHYHPYHKISQVDRDSGKVRTSDSGEPYYEWVRCEGRGCPICPQKVETCEARMLRWEMSYSHFKAITEAYQSAIGMGCKSCHSKKSIESLAWTCGFEGCGEAVIDMSDTTLKDDDIIRIVNEPVTCPECKNTGFLNEVLHCAKCGSAERCTIFDVDMNVRRVESGSQGKQLAVSDWSEYHPIDPRFAEIIKPFDMPKIYAPSTLEFQRKQFQIEGPATGQAAQPQGLTRTPVNTGFKQYSGQSNPGGANFSK